MSLTNLYVGYLKVNRGFQIVFILIKHGFNELMTHSFLSRRIRRRRIRHNKPIYTTQERLRLTIEDLGPTYIKFGQILADRPDVISERFRNELKKLQSNAMPFDDATAIRLIEDELGAELNQVFCDFNRECIASASIGQVYTAQLKDGTDVVVKIRRPNIDQKIKLDLYLMRYLAARLAKDYPEMAAINIIGVVDEFGESIVNELDYYNEAANILRFREMFRDSTTVYIPNVFMEHTTKRLIVMERINGITPDDPDKLLHAGLDTNQIALNGAGALLTMIMKEGFFHADPHAGNMFILPDNRIAFIDFGMVGVLRPRDMDFLANISLGFVRRDEAAIADALIKLCGVRYFDKRDDLIFSLQQMIRQFAHVPVEKLDYGKMIQECINLITKFGLCIPSGIFMLAKSLATIQKVAEQLDPDIPFAQLIVPYAKEIVMTRFSPRKLASDLYQTLKNYGTLVKNAPTDVGEILYKLKQGEIKHELKFHDSTMIEGSIRGLSSRIAYALLLVGLFLGSVILLAARQDIWYAHFLIWISSILIFLVIFKWIFRKKRK